MELIPIVKTYSGRNIQLASARFVEVRHLATNSYKVMLYGDSLSDRSNVFVSVLNHEIAQKIIIQDPPQPEDKWNVLRGRIQYVGEPDFVAQLYSQGIQTYGQLVSFSAYELKTLRVISNGAIQKIRAHLKKLGIQLRDEGPVCVGCEDFIKLDVRRPIQDLCGECIRSLLHAPEIRPMFKVMMDLALEKNIFKRNKKPEPTKMVGIDIETVPPPSKPIIIDSLGAWEALEVAEARVAKALKEQIEERPACQPCKGRGWFSVDMMGSSFENCGDCKGTGNADGRLPKRVQQ